MAAKKPTQKKRIASREDLINLLNSELVKIEMEFTQKVLKKFDEIISEYPLALEESVNLLRENRKQLGEIPSQKFFVDIVDGIFDTAEGRYENDIDNGDEHGFCSPLFLAIENYVQYEYELN